MKKKRVAVAVLASCITLSATMSGCSLVSLNSKKDMEQVIATVDISLSDKFSDSGLSSYSSAIGSTSIVKRELVSYFLTTGYSYVQNGYTYETVFNMLIDSLVENAVLSQYCTLELIKDKATNTSSTVGYDSNALSTFNSKETEVAKYEYLLGGEDSKRVQLAKYTLWSSLNSTLDSYEETYISESDSYEGTDSRTTPTNVDTENDDYYPVGEDGKSLYYGIYTGYENFLLGQSGNYQDDALEGTNRTTRMRAYNTFINNLKSNNLISDSDEDLTDVTKLEYYQSEYVTQLQQQVINEYYDIYSEAQESLLKDKDYAYISNVYNELLASQKASYEDDYSSFESALGDMSSSSFILYSPSTEDSDKFDGETNGTFGLVYNILLPFNDLQSQSYTALSSIYEVDEDANAFYSARNALLKQIQTTDQRSAWFNGTTDYSFNAKDTDISYYGKGTRDYLFFENNLTDNVRYKTLSTYVGLYSYNGKVYENTDGSYTLIPNKLGIDDMLSEFSAYVNYVMGSDSVTFDNGYVAGTSNESYYSVSDFYKKAASGERSDDDGNYLDDNGDKEIDYSKFVYASGKINFSTAYNHSDLFNSTDNLDQYKAMSAVNELQFAYTTDTSVLSQYAGYSVSAYDTSYIKEFEYAAKLAVSGGAGTFTVCGGQYGWHIIYVTSSYSLEGGDVYNPNWDRIDTEGTFENLFFEWLKSSNLSDITTTRRSKIISDYNKDDTVVKYESRYQNLLDLDSDS
jgi:hypothetical protein